MMDLKDFEKMLKICRKHSVFQIDFDGIHVKFAEIKENYSSQSDEIETEELSPDELIFLATQGQG